MNGYIQVRIMSAGSYFDCWQKVEGGNVVDYVIDDGEDGAHIDLPDPHEAYVLVRRLDEHLPIKAERLTAEAAADQ